MCATPHSRRLRHRRRRSAPLDRRLCRARRPAPPATSLRAPSPPRSPPRCRRARRSTCMSPAAPSAAPSPATTGADPGRPRRRRRTCRWKTSATSRSLDVAKDRRRGRDWTGCRAALHRKRQPGEDAATCAPPARAGAARAGISGRHRDARAATTSTTARRSTSAPSRSSAPRPTCRAFRADEAEVAIRMIHACGLVEAAQHFVFSPGFRRGRARRARRRRADLLRCRDGGAWRHPRAAAGRQRGDLHAARPAHRRARARRSATPARPPRSSCGATGWPARVVAIGNAPTALFYLLEMMRDGAPKPAAIIGMPVGFVGAAESKDALAPRMPRHALCHRARPHGRQRHDRGRRQRPGEGRACDRKAAAALSASAPARAIRSC